MKVVAAEDIGPGVAVVICSSGSFCARVKCWRDELNETIYLTKAAAKKGKKVELEEL